MQPRLYTFTQALRSFRVSPRAGRPSIRPRISQFICRTCRSKFSTSSILRKVAQVVKNGEKPGRYPTHLKIYDAGDMRTTWFVFWKATAIFQFGITAVFIAPMLYKNENQPDPNIRLLQAVGVTLAGAIPMALMSYLTAPFCKHISIRLPTRATQSLPHLLHFSRSPPPTTLLEFTTLRAYPIERKTAVLLGELRALPKQRWRFANMERRVDSSWRDLQKDKKWYRRVLEILNEPRFKFHVKEGRNYTIKTGVPGVWENVARVIQDQSAGATGMGMDAVSAKPERIATLVSETPVRRVKRQTARSSR